MLAVLSLSILEGVHARNADILSTSVGQILYMMLFSTMATTEVNTGTGQTPEMWCTLNQCVTYQCLPPVCFYLCSEDCSESFHLFKNCVCNTLSVFKEVVSLILLHLTQ
jgi:hypothetical protein